MNSWKLHGQKVFKDIFKPQMWVESENRPLFLCYDTFHPENNTWYSSYSSVVLKCTFPFPLFHFFRNKNFRLVVSAWESAGFFLREIWEAVTLIGYIGQYLLWTAPQLTCISSWLHFTQQGPFPLTQVCKYTLTGFNYTLIISKWRTICRHDHINPVAK